ncbi:MAG TPA: hypothetical protein PKN04_07550 [bacterium]|nr:hypothetical protein [bacterium]HNT65611.1 hypothetical protein [bacterium]
MFTETIEKMPLRLLDVPETRIEDPQRLLSRAIDRVAQAFSQYQQCYGLRLDEFTAYLQEAEPHIARQLNELHTAIDTDIAGRFHRGEIDGDDVRLWGQKVQEWRQLLLSALKLYALSQLGLQMVEKSSAN